MYMIQFVVQMPERTTLNAIFKLLLACEYYRDLITKHISLQFLENNSEKNINVFTLINFFHCLL